MRPRLALLALGAALLLVASSHPALGALDSAAERDADADAAADAAAVDLSIAASLPPSSVTSRRYVSSPPSEAIDAPAAAVHPSPVVGASSSFWSSLTRLAPLSFRLQEPEFESAAKKKDQQEKKKGKGEGQKKEEEKKGEEEEEEEKEEEEEEEEEEEAEKGGEKKKDKSPSEKKDKSKKSKEDRAANKGEKKEQSEKSEKSSYQASKSQGAEVFNLKLEREVELEHHIPAALALRRAQLQHEARLAQREMEWQAQQQAEDEMQEQEMQEMQEQQEEQQRLQLLRLRQQQSLAQQPIAVQPRPSLRQQPVLQSPARSKPSVWQLERSRGALKYTPAQMEQALRLRLASSLATPLGYMEESAAPLLGVSAERLTRPLVLTLEQIRGEGALAQTPVALQLGQARPLPLQASRPARVQQQRPLAMGWAGSQQQGELQQQNPHQQQVRFSVVPSTSWQMQQQQQPNQFMQPQLSFGVAPDSESLQQQQDLYEHQWPVSQPDEFDQFDQSEQLQDHSEFEQAEPVDYDQAEQFAYGA